MGTEQDLARNLFNAAIAFNDAQEAEYAAGEPAFSEAANARTRSAGLDVLAAGAALESSGNGHLNRERLLSAGLADYEIDFIAVQMVQVPYEVISNRDPIASDASGDTREKYALSVAAQLTHIRHDAPPGGISTESVNTRLREALGEELRGAKLFAPSDSTVNTDGVMKATLGNTLESQTLVEQPPGPRIG